MTLTSAHLVWTLLNSSQLFSPLVTSSTLPTSYHLRSTHLTSFSAHLNSSHLLNSGQLFSTLLTSCHRDAYTQSKLYTEKHLHTASSYTEKLFIDRSVYAQQAFTHSKLLHREAFTRRKLSHREAFTQTQSKLFHRASFCTEKLLHKASFYTQQFFTQRSFTLSSYTKRSFYTEKILHRASFFTAQAFAQRKFLHREGFTQSKLLHREAFTHSMLLHRSCYTGCAKIVRNICCQSNIRDLRFWAAKDAKSILHAAAAPGCSGDWVAKHTRLSHNSYTHCTSETGSRRPSGKTTILKHFLQGILQGKSSAPKWKKICCQSAIRNFHAATTIRFTTVSWKTQEYYARTRSSEPWRSHSTAICRDWVAKHTFAQQLNKLQLRNRISTPKRKNDDFEALVKRNFTRKIISIKMKKNLLPKHHSQFHAASTMRFTTVSCKTQMVLLITHAPAASRNLDTVIPLRLNCTTH